MTVKPKVDILFRQCAESDLPSLQSMVEQLYAADPNTQDVRPTVELTYRELLKKPDKGRLIVVERSGEIVGYCILIFFWSNEYGGNVIEIDEMFVEKNHRASGIGTELFTWLERTFPEDLAGFVLEIAHHNKAALKLTEKLGFSLTRNKHLIKLLRAGG